MARIVLTLFFLAGVAVSSAEAAVLHHPSKTVRTVEKGVAVWRGAKSMPAPSLKGGAPQAPKDRPTCSLTLTSVWPDRPVRVHGFYSGEATQTRATRLASRKATQGFFADRIAAGM
jgi:hypothetical protein